MENYELLPLEINAQLTEINRELNLCGSTYISIKNLSVDFATSIFSLLFYINETFSDCKVPFSLVYEKVYSFVEGYAEHIEKFKKEEEGNG